MGTTQRVASFVAKAKFEDIPTPAINMAKLCLLDGAGCALYSSTRPAGRIMSSMVEELGGKPGARVLGTNVATNAVNAAMANGVLVHLEDFDDLSHGHQSSVLTPTVLSLGEEQRINGKQALLSYLVGFDVAINIHFAMGEDHYGRGWHNPSSIGTLGATAAAAKILGLDEMQIRMALGMGATQASGLRANFGTMAKAFHPGNAARAGILSAKLAKKGFESHPDVIEHRFGYAAVFGDEMMHLSAIPRNLGNPWAIMGTGKEVANGANIKVWPCCGATHGANTAITRLLTAHPFNAEDVASVDIVTTHDPATVAANIRWPKTGLQGKFSPWYTVASCILDGGRLDLDSFSDEAVMRPAAQALLKKITVTQDPDHVGRPHRARGGGHTWDLSVTLKNGQVLNAPRSEAIGGRGHTYGWETREAVFEKFKLLAGYVMKPSQADAALDAIMNLEQATDLRQVVDTLVSVR